MDCRGRNAGFPTCCRNADFPVGGAGQRGGSADLETRDTADGEVCAAANPAVAGNEMAPAQSRFSRPPPAFHAAGDKAAASASPTPTGSFRSPRTSPRRGGPLRKEMPRSHSRPFSATA